MNKRGFTLIELLAVIAIIALLFTLGSKGIRSVRLAAKKAKARVEMKSIETAVKAYYSKYGRLPIKAALQGSADPQADEALSCSIISTLTLESAENNPDRVIFLDPQSHSADAPPGTFLDPWGKQYRIWMDSDYDQSLVVKVGPVSQTLRRKVALVAVGLYELNGSAHTGDLILGWE